jgi:hypothetical protein
MIFVSLLFVLTGFALVLQDFIPVIEAAYQARILLVPIVFFACALSVPFPIMLLLAFATGFVTDALNHTGVTYAADKLGQAATTFPDVGAAALQLGIVPPSSGAAFGFSIFLYGLLGALMHGIRPLFRRGRWELPVLMTGVGTALLLTLEYLFLNFRRGGFEFPAVVWKHILASAMLSMIAAPLMFFFIYTLSKFCNYRISYEGLSKRRRHHYPS